MKTIQFNFYQIHQNTPKIFMAGRLLYFNTLRDKGHTNVLGNLFHFEKDKLLHVARLCLSGIFLVWSSFSPLEKHKININDNNYKYLSAYHVSGTYVTSILQNNLKNQYYSLLKVPETEPLCGFSILLKVTEFRRGRALGLYIIFLHQETISPPT